MKRTKTILFVCVGNSCRSQMAEALARKSGKKRNLEFVSMGTRPAREVDPMAVEVLKEEGIIWRGKPKGIQDDEPIDVVVTMGCEVACPIIPAERRIEWDIPDPKGKAIKAYRQTLKVIKEKVAELLSEV